MATCRHDKYRVEYLHVIDCWDRADCVAWHCIRCGAVMERKQIGKTFYWPVIGYDPMVHIGDVWGRKEATR